MKQRLIFWLIGVIIALLALLSGARCSHASDRYDVLIQKYSRVYFSHAVDWLYFKSQVKAESAFNPNARSYVGAVGLIQVMPFTSREIAKELGIPNLPTNPEININMGIYYDRKCWSIFKSEQGMERLWYMFGAYNAGPGGVIRAQRKAEQNNLCTNEWVCINAFVPNETRTYVQRIREYYREYREE